METSHSKISVVFIGALYVIIIAQNVSIGDLICGAVTSKEQWKS